MAKDTGKTADTAGAGGEKTREAAPKASPRPKAAPEALRPVEELAAETKVKPWELAGLMRAAGWAEGKQVTPSVFARALGMFRKRPQGGGRIVV